MLDNGARKEVKDFLEFLLSKGSKSKQDLSAYKKRILKVSVWSEEDINFLIATQNKLNQWQPKEW